MPTLTLPPIDAEKLQQAADVLKTVAHPFRLQLIAILESGERTVNELCRELQAQQPYTSQQLNLLKAKGVLTSRRAGTQVFYRIANASVIKVIHCVCGRAADEGGGRGHARSAVLDCAAFPD